MCQLNLQLCGRPTHAFNPGAERMVAGSLAHSFFRVMGCCMYIVTSI